MSRGIYNSPQFPFNKGYGHKVLDCRIGNRHQLSLE